MRNTHDPRRWREPRRFVSLVEQLDREAQQRRLHANNEAAHEASLVAVTRWLVRATWLLVFVGFLAFGAAILQWRTLSSTDEKAGENITALQEQARIIRDQLDEMKLERRPWIAVDAHIGDIRWESDGVHIATKFDLTNTGKSPALRVSLNAELFPFYGR